MESGWRLGGVWVGSGCHQRPAARPAASHASASAAARAARRAAPSQEERARGRPASPSACASIGRSGDVATEQQPSGRMAVLELAWQLAGAAAGCGLETDTALPACAFPGRVLARTCTCAQTYMHISLLFLLQRGSPTAQEGVRNKGADLSLGAMGGRRCYRSERCHGRPFIPPPRYILSVAAHEFLICDDGLSSVRCETLRGGWARCCNLSSRRSLHFFQTASFSSSMSLYSLQTSPSCC